MKIKSGIMVGLIAIALSPTSTSGVLESHPWNRIEGRYTNEQTFWKFVRVKTMYPHYAGIEHSNGPWKVMYPIGRKKGKEVFKEVTISFRSVHAPFPN